MRTQQQTQPHEAHRRALNLALNSRTCPECHRRTLIAVGEREVMCSSSCGWSGEVDVEFSTQPRRDGRGVKTVATLSGIRPTN